LCRRRKREKWEKKLGGSLYTIKIVRKIGEGEKV